jgi:tetratricopeptide (TPR) repeat protein
MPKEKEMSRETLPPEVQQYVDGFVRKITEIEKEGYDNKLIPFSQKEDELKIYSQEFFSSMHQKIQKGLNLLKNIFEKEEKQNPKISEQASIVTLEKAQRAMKEKLNDPEFSFSDLDRTRPLQELYGLPWPFMDRAYQTANSLLQEKRYDEAECLYMFLCYLHPGVFEYWISSATCKQELGKLEEALKAYEMSLLWEPTNPLVFFQIASCYYQGKEKICCMKALNMCIDYAAKDEKYALVLKEASAVKQALTGA